MIDNVHTGSRILGSKRHRIPDLGGFLKKFTMCFDVRSVWNLFTKR
jgi:hypothetical protein